MRSRTLFFLLVWIVMTAALPLRLGAESALRNTLETAWKAYLEASRSGKESELEKTMSAFRLGTMRNHLASAKRTLTPGMIQSISEDAPDLSRARFVKLMENGPTAALVYLRDSDEKDASGKPRVEFTFIKFVKEPAGWKVDGAMNMGSPKVRSDGKETAFDASELPPTFEIDGQVREAPALVAAADFRGVLDVFSYGYETRVTINGVDQGIVLDKSFSGLIQGGLRKGENNVSILITKKKNDAGSPPTVAIRCVLPDRSTRESFRFEPKENIPGKHEFAFTILD